MSAKDSDLTDAREHVNHADIVLCICIYPPERTGGPAALGASCSVNPYLPGYALDEAADEMEQYAKELRRLAAHRTARNN